MEEGLIVPYWKQIPMTPFMTLSNSFHQIGAPATARPICQPTNQKRSDNGVSCSIGEQIWSVAG